MTNHKWTIPGEIIEDVFQRLPCDWELSIKLECGSDDQPLIQIIADDGVDWDWGGPEDGESLPDCISRLLFTVPGGRK